MGKTVEIDNDQALALALASANHLFGRWYSYEVAGGDDAARAILEVLDRAVPDFEGLIKFENLLRNREDELAAAWGRRPDDLKEGSPGWDPRFVPEWPESAERVMLRCMLGKVASLLCGWYAVRPVAVFGGCRGLHNCWGYEVWQAGYETVGDVADAGSGRIAEAKGIGSVKLAACRRFMEDYGFWEDCDEA